jgi:chromate reductase, NAD(P)H dehydrogenase (quinone)
MTKSIGDARRMIRILGISGSLRRDSYNRRLLANAAAVLPEGVELELWAGLRDVPPYDQDRDVDPAPAAVALLRQAIEDADAVLFATPEYNGSIPGQLKNAIDWASRPMGASVLRDKPAAVIGVSLGQFGAVWGQAELRKVLRTAGSRVVETEFVAGPADRLFAAQDGLTDAAVRKQLAAVVEELVRAVSPQPKPLAA